MTSTAQVPALLPALPELMLAGGAMLLLMLGAYRGERSAPVVALGAIMLLIAGIGAIVWLPGGKIVTFGGSFILDDFARFLKILAFGGSAAAILMSQTYFEREKQNRFEYPILILLATAGMGMMISAGDLIALYLGLELMSLSLYVLAAGNRDSERSTEAGPEIFRPRRLVVGHAALWLLADLRLYRLGVVPGDRASRLAGRARPDVRSRLPVRGPLLQGLGGAVPHVDAGRL